MFRATPQPPYPPTDVEILYAGLESSGLMYAARSGSRMRNPLNEQMIRKNRSDLDG